MIMHRFAGWHHHHWTSWKSPRSTSRVCVLAHLQDVSCEDRAGYVRVMTSGKVITCSALTQRLTART